MVKGAFDYDFLGVSGDDIHKSVAEFVDAAVACGDRGGNCAVVFRSGIGHGGAYHYLAVAVEWREHFGIGYGEFTGLAGKSYSD